MAAIIEPWGDKYRRTVSVIIKGRSDSPEVQQRVAMIARSSRDELIGQNRASHLYTTFVDGMQDAPEERVKIGGGTIVYLFSYLYRAALFGLQYAVDRSPERSGAYRKGWFIAVNGIPWTRPFEEIPSSAQVTISNREPYHRKIETGGQITSVPPGIVEDTRQAMQRRFPLLQIDKVFVSISAGVDARGNPVPYVLRGRGIESGLRFKKKQGWERVRASRPARAKDRRAGELLTYPAVVFSERLR